VDLAMAVLTLKIGFWRSGRYK